MRIADLLASKQGARALTISSTAPLNDAIEQLSVKKIGALVVSDTGNSIDGIISERDIVRALHQRGQANTAQLCVADLMTADVITCSKDMQVTEVMEQMNSEYIRHVPVAEGNQLVGLVSIRDIVSARVKEIEIEREQLEHYITGGGY